MSKKHSSPSDTKFSELRKIAEKILKSETNSDYDNISTENGHELNVYKVELEMQNDELLKTQSKLISSVEDYTQLFDYAPVSYFILDKNGVILNVNYTGTIQLGYNKKQLIGKHLSVFLNSKSSQDDYYRHRNLVIEQKKSYHFECEIKRNDKTKFFALIESTVVKNDNNFFKHILTTISDISEQKEYENKLALALKKEKELNQMKSQFITIASHEFRTPLATILSSSELLEKYYKPEDEEKRNKHYRKIKTAVHRLKEILIDFMSADEIEKNKIKNNPQIFNIVEFIEKIIKETKSFDDIHKISYKHVGDLQEVKLDTKLLKTSIGNLIINAYKYSPKGGNIEVVSEQITMGKISITVRDFGIGIPKDDETHIFEKFFRAKNADNIQGTGIGLSITKKMVQIMNGSISFSSEENKGTTFTVKIPRI